MTATSDSLPFQAVLALTEQLTGGSRQRLPWAHVRQILDDLTEGHFWIGYAWGVTGQRGHIQPAADGRS